MPLSSDLGIKVQACRLDSLVFHRRGMAPEGEHEIESEVGLGVSEPQGDLLTVRLNYKMVDASVMDIDAAYVVVLRRTEQFEFEGDELTAWRHVAARLAPVILYPFVRETIATTLQKAGLEGPMPPILDFRRVFDPESIKFTRTEQPTG
jgi:preprotein translocase subunit SecB